MGDKINKNDLILTLEPNEKKEEIKKAKPKESKLSFSARFALFDTDSYNSRIYSYENDVLYYFRIPAYYYQGARSYLTLRYQFKKGIDLWLRGSNWVYTNRNTIGTGINEILGPNKAEFRAQLRFQF